MRVKELIKKSFDECSNLIFPKVCLHCKEKSTNNFFCDTCLELFDLLDKSEIKEISSMSHPIVAAFDDIGVINTFFLELKKMSIPVFTKIAASYMACQYLNFGYEMPEIIVPLSEDVFGVKYIDIISKEISKILERPVKKMFFQSKIAILQNSFFIKQTSLQNKKLVLVTDILEEKKIIRAIEVLENQGFKDICILSFCQ